MRLAVLADIHGNLPALEAVTADLAARRVDRVIDLGDCVSGPLWPADTWQLLHRQDWPTVRGNHDRQVGQADATALGASDRYAAERLTDEARLWLATRPATLLLLGRIVAMHARPEDDSAYLLEDQDGDALRPASPESVATRLGALDAAVVLTAHSHRAACLRLYDGRWVLNPGSVGCPAYDDDSTEPPHVSEAGCQSARYAILDMTHPSPMIEFFCIPYDHEAAAAKAEASGRPDWAHALRTGFALRAAP